MSSHLANADYRALLAEAYLELKEARSELEAAGRARTEPIAVVGMGCRFPGNAHDPEAFWRLLADGVDAVSTVPPERWDVEAYYDPDPEAPGKMYTRYGSFLPEVDKFDPYFFGISPREAVGLDPQQRLLLEVSWEALEDAGQAPAQLRGSSTGVFVGLFMGDYAQLSFNSGDPTRIDAYNGVGNLRSLAAGRVAYVLGLQGPALQLDTACSSSLLAIHLACQSLRARECDAALAGGVNLILTPDATIGVCKLGALAADGRCKTFSAAADGYVRGEGCGMLVLKRLSDALAGGDRILALVRGSAVNHDGRSNGLTAPNGLAQEAVVRKALESARVEPSQIQYVEAHGTGTLLGDPIEALALGAVLGEGRSETEPLVIGSVKTNFGHLESAAGVAGLMKVVLALQHRVIPPHLHFREANPHIPWDDLPVVVPTGRMPWPKGRGPRLAGVSAFGMSGTNVHVVLEEAPEVAAAPPADESRESSPERPLHLLCLSAKNEEALRALAGRYEEHLASHPEAGAADICYTANAGRDHFSERIGVVAESTAQLRERLGAYLTKGESDGLLSGQITGGKPPQLAFLFTGQGSQYAGMGRHLFLSSPAFRRPLQLCDRLLAPHLDRSLLSLLFSSEPADASLLDQTAYTQPALFAFEYSLAQLWLSWGVRPVALLGHSLGEYVAACLAGVFSLDEALGLVAARGRLMQGLPAPGAMASVAGEAEEVEAVLAPWRGEVVVAALNGPRQTVIAGGAEAVGEACQALSERGVRARSLRVSQAFHSPLVEPMLGEFAALAARVSYRVPQVPVISNLSGGVAGEELTTAEYWVRQAREPVRFGAGVAALAGLGVGVCLEVGPQPVLSRLAGESPAAQAAGVEYVHSLERGRGEWEQMLSALAGLYVRGVEVEWAGYERGYVRRRVALPTYPFQRQRYWVSGGREVTGPRPRTATPEAGAHPLLGHRMAEAWAEGARFELGLSAARPAYLAEHRVFGAAVVPAAAYLEMMRAAAGEIAPGGAVELAGASFRRALILADGREQRLQVVARPDAQGSYEVRIYSASDEEAEPSWVLHATASALAVGAEGPAAPVDLRALRARCPREVSAEELYENYRGRGLDYGPSFRPIRNLWRGEGEALALLHLPEGLEGEAARYELHPSLLDGAFQALGAVFIGGEAGSNGDNGGGETELPVGLRRLRFYETPGRRLWCHARVVSGGGGQVTSAELHLISPEGRLVAAAEGLETRRARRESVLGEAPEPTENWLYEIAWREQALAPRPSRGASGNWLILADGTDGASVGQELAARLRAEGEVAKMAWAGRGWAELGAETCELDAESADDYRRLVRWASEGEGDFGGVVYLWGLGADQESTGEQGAEEMRTGPWGEGMGRDLGRVCRQTLLLAQGLAGAGLPKAPRLWLVTRGAQPAGAPVTAAGLAQAPVWGLGKTVALEQPELKCTLVDLGPEPGAEDAANLSAELLSGSEEREVAYGDGARRVARLTRYGQGGGQASDAARRRVPTDGPYELSPAAGGELSGLHFRQTQRRPPGPGEVEIEARAWSLNFKDVLNAMGLYPGDAGALGSECAGRVVEVGAGVTELTLGDEVVVMMPGSFRSHLTVEAWQAAPKPPGLSLEQAASLPVAFLTAAYGLRRLARLAAGERVLIHSAAGGVGMAAIQIAHLAGAEVLATSSPGKWETVRGLGVERVFNSRTLEFGDEVLEATGGRGVEVVLNSLTGEAIERSLAALSPDGRFVEIGRRGIWSPAQVAALRPAARYDILDLGAALANDREALMDIFRELLAEFAAGDLKPLPLTVYPVEEAVEAFRQMQQGKHVGKIVIRLPEARGGAAQAAGEVAGVWLEAEASYLITGGLGGLGLEVAGWMAERGARHLLLVGRRVEGAGEREEVRELEARGVRVRVVAADLSRREEVRRVIAEAEGWGRPLRGVVHAAGVTDDGVLARQSWERFAGVLGGKALGAWHLHEETKAKGLEFFVLFASAAGVLGNGGQGSYAAANAFLDGLAQHRRGEGLPALSIDWGAWSEVGMAARMSSHDRERSASRGVESLTSAQGTRALEALMARRAVQAGVFKINWPQYLQQYLSVGVPPFFEDLVPKAERPASPRPKFIQQLTETPAGERDAALTSYLRSQVATVLGWGSPAQLQPRQSLFDLGLDSLMTIELKNSLESGLGLTLSSSFVYDYPTIEGMVSHLSRTLLKVDPDSNSTPESESDVVAEGIDWQELEELSEPEAEALLLQELDRLKY